MLRVDKMKKKILLLGGSSNTTIVASVIDRIPDMEVMGVVNDYVEIGTSFGEYKKIPVVAKTDQLLSIFDKDPSIRLISVLAGMTNPRASYEKLLELYKTLPRERWTNVIDPAAVVPLEYCKLGVSVFVGPLAQISPNTTIGNFCMLMGNAFVGHNTVLDDFVHVTSNAVVGANMRIGIGVHVGTNSVTRGATTVGEYSIIGSGAVVLRDVETNSVVAGNPAKFIKQREDCRYGLDSKFYVPFK